jgi:hypothetical protein
MRTLHFNLKDPHNSELRAHVLRGDIEPRAFVRLSATELASKVRDDATPDCAPSAPEGSLPGSP